MTTDTIRLAIAQIAKRPPSEIQPAQRLTEDLGIRSLARVELAVLLEEKLGRSVPDQTVMIAKTVADLESRLAAPPP